MPNCNIKTASLKRAKLPLSQKRESAGKTEQQDRRGELPVLGLPFCDFNEMNGEQRIWNCLRFIGGFLFATRRVVRDRDR